MRLLPIALAVTCACGRVAFDPLAPIDGANADVSFDGLFDHCAFYDFDLSLGILTQPGTPPCVVMNGALQCQITGMVNSATGMAAPRASFIGRSIALRVVQRAMYPNAYHGPGIHGDTASAHLYIQNGMVSLFGGSGAPVPASSAQPWLRLREEGGDAIGEVSD